MNLDIIYNKSSQRMPELPDWSIDTVMTSPPYWGLRDYGDDVKEIWGGDNDCYHKWEIIDILRKATPGDLPSPKSIIAGKRTNAENRPGKPSEFCQFCHAWQGQLGLEPTFQLYLDHLMIVCAEIKRVLKKTGSFWLNMGDTYATHTAKRSGQFGKNIKNGFDDVYRNNRKPQSVGEKCLIGIPWRLVLRLIDEQGWILRNAIIWHKPNAMPSSVKDRCSNSYEFLFHLVKAKKYYHDLDAIREPYTEPLNRWGGDKLVAKGKSEWDAGTGQDRYRDRDMRPNKAGKNPGDVWTIPTQPRPEAHFATFPDKLCIKPILATCPMEICKKCGKARVRITKSHTTYESGSGKSGNRPKGKYKDLEGTGLIGKNLRMGPTSHVETIGWTDCGCNAGWDSGILLDPFAGRGTSLIMTKKLGRHYVGYELKKEYADMAERELEEIDPLFRRDN